MHLNYVVIGIANISFSNKKFIKGVLFLTPCIHNKKSKKIEAAVPEFNTISAFTITAMSQYVRMLARCTGRRNLRIHLNDI